MQKDEAELEGKGAELLAVAEATDAAEDTQYGKNRRGDELPEDLRRAQGRRYRWPATATAYAPSRQDRSTAQNYGQGLLEGQTTGSDRRWPGGPSRDIEWTCAWPWRPCSPP